MVVKLESILKGAPLRMDARLAIGFGAATLTRDGEVVWEETGDTEWEDCLTVEQAETLAAADPDRDWRIHINAPLSEFHYQRHGEGAWMLYERGLGFT